MNPGLFRPFRPCPHNDRGCACAEEAARRRRILSEVVLASLGCCLVSGTLAVIAIMTGRVPDGLEGVVLMGSLILGALVGRAVAMTGFASRRSGESLIWSGLGTMIGLAIGILFTVAIPMSDRFADGLLLASAVAGGVAAERYLDGSLNDEPEQTPEAD